MAILDVIEWVDQGSNEIVHRVPEYGSGEFRLGSQCIVRDSQVAVFFRDGKALDTLPPGRHTLSTQNIPILAGILSIPFGHKSPFRAEVVYVSLKEFLDMKWGTPQPIIYRDSDLGVVRLRSFGTYAMRVVDPQLFVNTIVGTQGVFRAEDIGNYLRSIIVQQLTVLMGQVMKSVLDLAVMYEQLALATKTAVADQFAAYGLQLDSFQIGAITPPDEVQAKIDERSSMGALGNLDQYMKYRTAQAIGDAANNPGSGGDALGAGIGFGLGSQIASAMRQQSQEPTQSAVGSQQSAAAGGQAAPSPSAGGSAPTMGPKFCPNCGFSLTAMPDGGPPKFCPNCGNKLRD
ncbi:MAG: SPFH domain-containing protein [Chloroflexota bacterium]|nr:SPFH domain-containing protein [Chloroflexota bacterium]